MDPIPPRPPSPFPRPQSAPPALDLFQDNLDQADPTGLLRALGEFLQTFSAKPGHPSEGRTFAFRGGLDPETGSPEFDRLRRPEIPQLREWQERYGNATVTPPPGGPHAGSPPAAPWDPSPGAA